MSTADLTWQPRHATAALARLRALRRQNRRAARRSVSLLDRLFPFYLMALFGSYAALVLSGTRDVTVGNTPIAQTAAGRAATSCLGCLSWVAILAAVVAVAASAIDGGPIKLPAEDLRILLTAPIPRSAVLRRALGAAYLKALVAAAAAAGVLLLVEVAMLAEPLRSCVFPAIFLPVFVAIVAVSGGWLIEASPRGALVGRACALSAATLLLATAVWVAAAIGPSGQLAAWRRLHQLGGRPVIRSLVDPGQPGTSLARSAPTFAVLAACAVLLTALGLLRVRSVSAEQLIERSGRSVAVRTALLVGMTSSAYVTRTARARRRRKLRWAPNRLRSPRGALFVKALLQEQGTPILARVTLAAAATSLIDGALFARRHQTTLTPTLVVGIAAGLVLAAVATRFADPLRIDIELNTPAGSLPLGFHQIAMADLGAPALTFTAGGVIAAVVTPALSVVPWTYLPLLLAFGVALGPAAAGICALSAASNVPLVLASSAASFAVRARGLIAGIVVMSAVALAARPTHNRSEATAAALAGAIIVLVALTALVFRIATGTSSATLLRER